MGVEGKYTHTKLGFMNLPGSKSRFGNNPYTLIEDQVFPHISIILQLMMYI